jgi:hypothetical protein
VKRAGFSKYMLLKIEILLILLLALLANSHIFEISFFSPGVNSRAETVPSPQANDRNGAVCSAINVELACPVF